MDQLSYRFLHEEFRQLATMTRVFPTIFLGVAAFLLNVVFTRLVGTQRDQVAILKAFGYSTLDVALHYGLIVTLICLIGSALGVAGEHHIRDVVQHAANEPVAQCLHALLGRFSLLLQ